MSSLKLIWFLPDFDTAGETLLNTQTPRNFVVDRSQAVKFCNLVNARIRVADVKKSFASNIKIRKEP